MSEHLSTTQSESVPRHVFSAQALRSLSLGVEVFTPETQRPLRWRRDLIRVIARGFQRRWAREQRRRKVGRAYDMALEIARVIPYGSEVLDVGCGNGFIAHHLSALLGTRVLGIDLTDKPDVSIDYRRYDGAQFPLPNRSCDAVLLCYVLHHAQDAGVVLNEIGRVLRDGGLAVVYEDIPGNWWDEGVCWIHNRQWRGRTGPCTFRRKSEWRALFSSCGFETVRERPLSRWRNLNHPVGRNFYLLRRSSDPWILR